MLPTPDNRPAERIQAEIEHLQGLASIFRAALDRVGGAGSSQPVALIVACGCEESPDVAPVSGFS